MDFITPGAGILVLRCGRVDDIVKMRCFFGDLLYSRAQGMLMMSGEGSANVTDFMAFGAGFLCWGVAR